VLKLISPHTEELLAEVPISTPEQIDEAVAAARAAIDSGPWPRTAPGDRVAVLRRFAEIYRDRSKEIAALITAEIGAPITFAQRAQVGLPAMMIGAFCDTAEAYDWQEIRPGFFGSDIHIRKEPVGVVAAIVPWNMPQFLTIAKLVPALLAGCAVIVKPAPETSLDALLLARLLEAAGLPPGVLTVLPGDNTVGERLVSHPGVDKVSFTGSTAVGRSVAAACAANLTKVSLELGGKSAAIVLGDAGPGAVAAGVRAASLSNSGQICNALTRIIVPASRQSEFVDALAAEIAGIKVGDPTDPETQLGPLVNRRQQQRVLDYIRVGGDEGARLVTGGTDLPAGIDRGWYVRPTLFADAHNSMRIAQEEIFGPVLTVIGYRDEQDAIAIANDSGYGLAGSVWTADTERGLAIAAQVKTGTFGVNQGYTMDPFAPFGGVKDSGYGRELGREGLEGYLETKSIAVAAGV
jgi:aldehyde dehydrogenase (NAD+)